MIRSFRLSSSDDFRRVRQTGKSYAHPLVVLIILPNGQDHSRFAVAASRAVGKAVQRNRAKRRLREALRPLLPAIAGGWDVILLARRSIVQAPFADIRAALHHLLQRANLI